MESLAFYSSEDEENSDYGQKNTEAQYKASGRCSRSHRSDDTNYDTIGMDLSEDSSNGNEGRSHHPESHRERNSDGKKRYGITDLERRTTDYHRDEKEKNSKHRERNRDNYKEERNRNQDKRKDYRPRKDYRRDREDYRERDEHLNKERERERERDREYKTSRVEKTCNTESSNFRDRSRRQTDRQLSPRNRKDRKRHQSRSRSRDSTSFSRSSTDNLISSNKVKDHEHKSISQSGTTSSPSIPKDIKVTSEECKSNTSASLPSYYNPNVINPNKYAEQVQKRKLLWSNKKPDDNASKWGTAKFAQDTDGKVQSKFMRLMGIKATPKAEEIEEPTGNSNSSESIKKREEMFSSMEQQYEVARQVTHTMRGVGLGFSSQSRQF